MFQMANLWVIPYQGHGIDRPKAEACWRMVRNPDLTTRGDIAKVFLNVDRDASDRYWQMDVDHVPCVGGMVEIHKVKQMQQRIQQLEALLKLQHEAGFTHVSARDDGTPGCAYKIAYPRLGHQL